MCVGCFVHGVCGCQVLDLTTGPRREPGGEQASSNSSGSSNVYGEYGGGTLSAVPSLVGGHSLGNVSIPSSGCPPRASLCDSVPLPSLLKPSPLPFFPVPVAPLRLGTGLNEVDKGEEFGQILNKVSPNKSVTLGAVAACKSL